MSEPCPNTRVMSFPASVPASLSWDYAPDTAIAALYERAKSAQWNATTDIDWSVPVEFGAPIDSDGSFDVFDLAQSPLAQRDGDAWVQFRWHFQAWIVSQFLHAEQAALVAASRLSEAHPDVSVKLFAASQAGDEARHVEVFARYVNEKIKVTYPISGPLRSLLQDVFTARDWDVTCLGMQILLEGLALASFRIGNATFHDPLIREITQKVAADEARHVAFGVLALRNVFDGLSSAEKREREEFVVEASNLLRRRFLLTEVWERVGVDTAEGERFAAGSPMVRAYCRALFARIVPTLVRLGLFTPAVRTQFDAMGLLPTR